jgi:reactive intermediate/imine deaminase
MAAGACASSTPQHTQVQFVNSGRVMLTTLPFSELVRAGDTLYLSGQIAFKPGTKELVPGGTKEQAKQILENIRTSLTVNGYAMSDLVKCTVMLIDMKEWADFNEIYSTFFPAGRFPARSALGVTGLAFDARIEVECLGVVSH